METKANDLIRNNEYKISKRKINEESKNNENNIILNNHNKLIDSQEFFFNYRNDNAFNQINNLETKPLNNKYNNENIYSYSSSMNIPFENKHNNKYIIHENYYKNNLIGEKSDNDLYNNKLNNSKYYDLKNSINSIDSNKMREISMEDNEIRKQIKYEERKLNELKEEKMKLIDEDKKRREMILLEIDKNKKEIKNKKEEINEILNECKIEKNQLKENYNIQNNYYKGNENNSYREYLKNIRKRNEIINEKSKEIIERKINKENQNNNTEAAYKNKKIFDKNALKIENKKEEEKEIYSSYKKLKNYNIYSHGMYNSYNKRLKYNCSCPNEPSVKEKINKSINWSVKRKKEKMGKMNKIYLYSYFKLNEKEKNFNENKSNNKTSIEINNKYLTPNKQYREKKTAYSKENNSTHVYKILSSNEYNNFMTQTRFYRSKINMDELSSNYAKEKALKTKNNINRSYYKNREIYIFPDPLNNSKDYFENYKINKSATNLMNLIDNKNLREENNNDNNKTYNEHYFNYSNNMFSSGIKRLSNYKSNSFLEKGKTYSNTKFVEIKNNKMIRDRPIKYKKYICYKNKKKMIH